MNKKHRIRGGGELELHVEEWGRAGRPCLLFVHGWSQSLQCWRAQYDSELAEDFHLVALDLRGHGNSAKPLAANNYTDSNLWADDIAAVITKLNLQHPLVSGWSYGGLVICDYLRKYGDEQLGGIHFVGAATELNERVLGTLIGPGFIDNVAAATCEDLDRNINAIRKFLDACIVMSIPRQDWEYALCYNMVVPAQIRAHLVTRDLSNIDVLAQIKRPVLITHGEADVVVLPASAEHVKMHCASATVSRYPGVGHNPFIEAPARFNRELVSFARATLFSR